MKQVLDHLKHPRFQFTEIEEEADIIWTFSHIREYRWAALHTHMHTSIPSLNLTLMQTFSAILHFNLDIVLLDGGW